LAQEVADAEGRTGCQVNCDDLARTHTIRRNGNVYASALWQCPAPASRTDFFLKSEESSEFLRLRQKIPATRAAPFTGKAQMRLTALAFCKV
jgi:hypothetical protein